MDKLATVTCILCGNKEIINLTKERTDTRDEEQHFIDTYWCSECTFKGVVDETI